MKIKKVNGLNKDFYTLCEKLQNFQYSILPVLKENGYTLTDNLQEVSGFILYVNNKPVGSIGLKKVNGEVCEIVRVFVSSEFRGKGYAKLLFSKIEALAKSLGYKKAEITAWAFAKEALGLYEKLGYTKSEEKVSEWFGGFKYVELFKYLSD